MNTHHNEDEQPLSQDELSDSQMMLQNYNNDDRLHYTLLTLGLEELVNLFMDNNITFVDLLLLCKEDLIDLRLPLYQRNRIFNFAQMFNKYAKNYTINEITDFFIFHKQFIFNSTLVERITTNQNVITQNNNNNNYQLTGSFNVNSGGNNNNNENELRYDNEDGVVEHKGNNVHKHSHSKQNKHKMTLSTSKEILKDDDNNNNINNNNNNFAHVYHNDIHTQQKPNKHKSKTTSNVSNNNNNKDINTNINTPEYAAYISNKNVKNKLNTNIAYKKYIETKKEADQVLEQLTKLKEDQHTKHNKYHSLMKRTTKGKYNYTSNTNGIDYNNNNNNNYDMNYYNNNNEMHYEDGNEQGYEGEEENELQNEYDKMASKIEEIEKMKMDYNTFMLLNKIKNQVINKGDNITFEDINAVNEKLIALEEVINKKEMLRQNLQNKKESIEKTKNLLNNIDNGCNNNMNVNYNCNEYNCQGDVNEVEEVQEEYEQESEDQINYKENSM